MIFMPSVQADRAGDDFLYVYDVQANRAQDELGPG
jgi:hypothetical protein